MVDVDGKGKIKSVAFPQKSLLLFCFDDKNETCCPKTHKAKQATKPSSYEAPKVREKKKTTEQQTKPNTMMICTT